MHESVNVYQVPIDAQGIVPGLNSGLVYGEGKEDVSKKWDTLNNLVKNHKKLKAV